MLKQQWFIRLEKAVLEILLWKINLGYVCIVDINTIEFIPQIWINKNNEFIL